MTAFLTINGWTVPVVKGGGSRAMEAFLETSSRSLAGQLSTTDRGQKPRLACKTPPMDEIDALNLMGLLNGRGHHVSFSDGMSAAGTGLGPDSGRQGAALDTAQKVYGDFSLRVGSAGELEYDAQLDDDYTIMVWHRVSSWELLTVVYDALSASYTKYIGTTSGSTINNQPVSSGKLLLQGETTAGAGSVCHYDDLVILPFQVCSDFVAAVAGAGVAFSDMPVLSVNGTSMFGQNVSYENVIDTRRSVSFELVTA